MISDKIYHEYNLFGLCCIPCGDDKRPALLPGSYERLEWSPFQTRFPTDEELTPYKKDAAKIACICGKISGGLAALDFDVKHGDKYDEWCIIVTNNHPEILSKCVVEQSPSGGHHVIFRTETEIRNTKLARKAKDEDWIETRGEGGYFVCAPSPGYVFQYGDFSKIQKLSSDETEFALSAAISLNEFTKEKHPEPQQQTTTYSNDGLSPFDDYNQRIDIVGLLVQHGWKECFRIGEAVYLKRPGKDGPGISATWNKIPDRFYCFTTSTAFENQHIYKASAVYAILEHGGDYKAAAKALYDSGYGDRAKRKNAPEPEVNKPNGLNQDDICQSVLNEIGHGNLINCNSGLLKFNEKIGTWEIVPISEYQSIVQSKLKAIVPPEKFTNTLVRNISDLTRRDSERGNFQFDNQGDDSVVALNGIVRFIDGGWQLQPHSREEYRTIHIPIVYSGSADAPKFKKFLDEIFVNDPDHDEKVECVFQMIGYSLMQHSGRFERFIMLIGYGGNGKSVLLFILKLLVGSENCAAVQPSLFGNQFHRAYLHRKLVNIVSELQAGAVIDDAALKAIVSGESMNVSRKHETPFDMTPFCTCWFGTNFMPHTRDFTDAMFRRATILQFNRQFLSGVDANPQLKTAEYWQNELQGILNCSLQAYGRAIKRGSIIDPKSSIEAKHEWFLEADQTAAFVEECIDRVPGRSVGSSDLYQAFRSWAEGQGISHVVSHKAFTNRLELKGIKNRHTMNGTFFDGISLSMTDMKGF